MLEFIILSPLFGAFVCGFFHKVFGEKQVVLFATVILLLSAIASWLIFLGLWLDQILTFGYHNSWYFKGLTSPIGITSTQTEVTYEVAQVVLNGWI